MAKRTITSKVDTNIPTALVVGREYFKEELNKRIVLGEEIYTRRIPPTNPILPIFPILSIRFIPQVSRKAVTNV
jgi:hypothetical protein